MDLNGEITSKAHARWSIFICGREGAGRVRSIFAEVMHDVAVDRHALRQVIICIHNAHIIQKLHSTDCQDGWHLIFSLL